MSELGSDKVTTDAVAYVIQHLVLPPKLLPQDDDVIPKYETFLLKTTIKSLEDFRTHLTCPDQSQQVDSVTSTVKNLLESRDATGFIDKSKLGILLVDLISGATKGAIPLHISVQNAGFIINRHGENITFEAFELSPSDEAVTVAKGRLVRSFPAYSSTMTLVTLAEKELQNALCQTLSHMASQPALLFQKGMITGNTPHPGIVTSFFMNAIAALGDFIKPTGITKNTREEVTWFNNSQCWRRSPLWLLLRVSMQLQFSRVSTQSGSSDSLYKPFMAFFLSRILDQASKCLPDLDMELVHFTSSKLSRRLQKMENYSQASPAWMDSVLVSMRSAHDIIHKVWKSVINQTKGPALNRLQSLHPDDELNVKLRDLNQFIDSIAARKRNSSLSDFQPTTEFEELTSDELPNVVEGQGEYRYFTLMRIENWVESHLPSWFGLQKDDHATCGNLRNLIQAYHSIAAPTYKGLPESYSIMYLTIMELWVACDVFVCNMHPLLRDFAPEVPVELLQSLLLPLKAQMVRLCAVETYISHRRSKATANMPSLFRDFGHHLSFAVKYFDQSLPHQLMLSEIDVKAAETKARKCKELADKSKNYKEFMTKYQRGICDEEVFMNNLGETGTRHCHLCKRCEFKVKAQKLIITVYEWPLSLDSSLEKATVFELMVPEAYSNWRDVTIFLIKNVLESEYAEQARSKSTLKLQQQNMPLLPSRIHHKNQRIIPVSKIKPNTTRRLLGDGESLTSILNEEDVCVNNRLKYAYFDEKETMFTEVMCSTERVFQNCTLQLPARSTRLQKYLSRPPSQPNGLLPNEVVAGQSACPLHMSLDEYKALCALPLGSNVQYMNILVQLAMPALDFGKVETQCFILQTVHQAGQSSDQNTVERVGHGILTDEHFGVAMIQQLELSLQRFTENWESWRAMASFIKLSARLLSFATHPSVQKRCLDFLSKARTVSLSWLRLLKDRARSSIEDTLRAELQSRAVEIALICISTFDVDHDHLVELSRVPSALSVLIQASIAVQENKDSVSSDYSSLHCLMVQSWRSLSCRVMPFLKSQIVDCHSSCLTDAVTISWAGFRPTSVWKPLGDSRHHWLEVKSGSNETTARKSSQVIHFNMLTAELLVDGIPLTRLPQDYMQHSMYLPLFGKSSFEVVPTTVPGFQFSAKHEFQGYEISLGMEGPNLLVHAVQHKKHFDLLPPILLRNKIPPAFVTDFVHWYDHENEAIEFRPYQDPWSTSSGHWRLTKVGSLWRLNKLGVVLLDITKAEGTSSCLSNILATLEVPSHIHVLFDVFAETLEIELPRLQLGFFLRHGGSNIYSRQYHGMMIDPDQIIGTLTGLSEKLVLKHEDRDEDRLVLIPEGVVEYKKTEKHMLVCIETDVVAKIHTYHLDHTLGRLVDNGNLQSKLFLCYLHALTSSCLPDPLTGYTGIESAISILRSAAVRSFNILSKTNISILELIARLAPARNFHIPNKRNMQVVKWNSNLPTLSQSSSLYELVQEIFDISRTHKFFHCPEVYTNPPELNFVDPHFLQRDLIRSSSFRVSEFGAENYDIEHDTIYQPRDQESNRERSLRAFVAAKLVTRDEGAFHTAPISLDSFRGAYFSRGIIDGPKRPLDILQYNPYWLHHPFATIPSTWCALHSNLAKPSAAVNKFSIMFWLSTVAFAEEADMDIVEALAALYRLQTLHSNSNKPPAIAKKVKINLSEGEKPSTAKLKVLIKSAVRPFETCPEANIPEEAQETNKDYRERRHAQYRRNSELAVETFILNLKSQWPCESPQMPADSNLAVYIDTTRAMPQVQERFKSWWINRRFYMYLGKVCTIFAAAAKSSVLASEPEYLPAVPSDSSENFDYPRYFSTEDIFSTPAPSSLPKPPKIRELPDMVTPVDSGQAKPTHPLELLCLNLGKQAQSKCEKTYVRDLESSISALQNFASLSQSTVVDGDTLKPLQMYSEDCSKHLKELSIRLEVTAKGEPQRARDIATYIKHAPRVSPTFWLRQLNRDRWFTLPEDWKEPIIQYGLAITAVQRARRLLVASKNSSDLAEEIRNIGHQNWDPENFPESLLLETESGIMIREVQEEIAAQMRSPPNNRNSVMQLNMGEGKSSVVVPIVAAALADGTRLVRVIVAKAQSKQMYQMLLSKFGGLLNRRIHHLPFSRTLALSEHDAFTIGNICRNCMTNGGILLVQPEHLLSFRLMGVECLLSDRKSTGQALLSTQDFFDAKSRDIVDESDECFSVKLELVYAMGTQRPVEMSPDRWTIIQEVLTLVRRFAKDIKNDMPLSIEVDDRWVGRYPRIRTLRQEAVDLLLNRIAKHICEVGFAKFPLHRQPPSVRNAVFRYISQAELTTVDISAVEHGDLWKNSKNTLLLLRGLIAGGVLRFVLSSKRWRVNFGTDPNRNPDTRLAVPFRSKDSPSPRSEFSHPDVIIVLTSFAYYYGGLSDNELFDTFSQLLKSDHADVEYNSWIESAGIALPNAFRQLIGVNIKDRLQCVNEVFPTLRYSKAAIDFFLARLVFPKEMKEFPQKLSASGWDIGKAKTHPTTGFSGTNDSRHFLPLSMEHLNLSKQRCTNALVLGHLLQDKNLVKILPPRATSMGSDAEHLISIVNDMSPPTRVILDVGAQILELNNREVAEKWLSMTDDESIKAAVFFTDDEELSVLDRKGYLEHLQVSPYARQLGSCLIYLDEAHTRGTDLKLPRDYRAAVSLGAHLTKDRLVQACMRMRKLGNGQSIVFCITKEIKTKIVEQASKSQSDKIEVTDVLAWAISETWADLRRGMPLWATQGRRFENHKLLLNGAQTSDKHAEAFLEDESLTLDHRYRPHPRDATNDGQPEGWDMSNKNIKRIVARCHDFDAMTFNSSNLQEEQERELSPEIEAERELERPASMQAEQHKLDSDLIRLVKEGVMVTNSRAFIPAFEALSMSSAAAYIILDQFPKDLLVTADYIRTVKRPSGLSKASYVSDLFQRPVQWILTVPKGRSNRIQKLVILSPFEAEQLLPVIRASTHVTLHLYSPRPNLSYQPLDDLNLYTMGHRFNPNVMDRCCRSLIVQLNVFAGQLYFHNYEQYVELCDYLGLAWKVATDRDGDVVMTDGMFTGRSKWGLKNNPVDFLKILLTKIRRDCEGVEKTHMGKILDGALLEKGDFQQGVHYATETDGDSLFVT